MAQYPIPVFHFIVEWGGNRVGFTEVSGLDREVQAIEYREGNSPNYFVTKMPGMEKFGNLTLKRGVFAGDNDFVAWLTTVKLNTIERRDLTISLLNENHEPMMVWKALNCWPCKLTGVSLNSTGNEVAVESIDVCFEQLLTEVLA
ncbi:MAG TPA: phage tail protein [Flavobacteriales bacterium]|nr:phage tail protein [Flavobacteriales bacterium]